MQNEYDKDLVRWAQTQSELIKSGQLDRLDLVNIAQEIESLAKTERRRATDLLVELLSALLTWQVQPLASEQAALEIQYVRLELSFALQDSPSLKCVFIEPDYFSKAWQRAILQAQIKSGLERESFPAQCEWEIEQILNSHWWPA